MRIHHATGSIVIAVLSVTALAAAAPVTPVRPPAATAAPALWIVQAASVAAARRDVDGVGARVEQELEIIHAVSAYLNPWQIEHLRARAGVHTGEIEVRGDDLAGMAVHIGARVSALAAPGEVLVSGSVPPLVAGSGLVFHDRGEHELKGVPGHWRLFAAT